MCRVCKRLEKLELPLDEDEAKRFLEAIANAMGEADPGDREEIQHLSDLLDRVLGTTLEEEDAELGALWENKRRGI